MSIGETIPIVYAQAALRRLLVPVRTQQYLLDISDRALRRLELLFPLNSAEQQAALYWIAEQGDEEDVLLLESLPPDKVVCSRDVYESVRQKLSGRAAHVGAKGEQSFLSEYLVKVGSEVLPGIKDSLRGLLEASRV